MLKTAIAISAVAALMSGAVNAYDPDGFHECILDHVESDMSKAAVFAVRESCAHQNRTTLRGNRLPPKIAEDSFMQEFKREHAKKLREGDSCKYPLTIDQCIVMAIRDAWYPSRNLEEVKRWLYRSRSEYGPIPPKEN